MKKTLVALAAAAAISPAAFAGDVSWGGDANVEGFIERQDTDATPGTETDNRGYTQRVRLKGTFKTDGNVSVNTRLVLDESAWTGDDFAVNTYSNNSGDGVRVDYSYIQAPIAGWTFRFGRQIANWANCFLTCDDRRDRILAMKRFGGTTLILLNDKRASTSNDETSYTSEGDLYVAAAVGVVKGWQWGVLVGKWIGEPNYILDEVFAISPFVKGKAGPVKLEGAINILGGGEDDYAAFRDTVFSMYVKAGMEVGAINLEGQMVYVQEGNLVAPGFDTFSILLSNTPDNNQTNTNVHSMGGLGKMGLNNALYGVGGGYTEYSEADDEILFGFRASGKAGKIGWKAAVTYLALENDRTGFEEKWNMTTLDGGVTYAVAKTTEVYLNAAIGAKDDETAANVDVDYQAATVGITTTF